MEFNLSEEQNLLIDTTKSFVKAELLQHEELLEKTNNLPKELYDEIKKKTGFNEKEVIKIMRSNLKKKSYLLWRKRMRGRITKHRKLFKYKFSSY